MTETLSEETLFINLRLPSPIFHMLINSIMSPPVIISYKLQRYRLCYIYTLGFDATYQEQLKMDEWVACGQVIK